MIEIDLDPELYRSSSNLSVGVTKGVKGFAIIGIGESANQADFIEEYTFSGETKEFQLEKSKKAILLIVPESLEVDDFSISF